MGKEKKFYTKKEKRRRKKGTFQAAKLRLHGKRDKAEHDEKNTIEILCKSLNPLILF